MKSGGVPPLRVVLDEARCLLLHGDALGLGPLLPVNCVDSIVTDPPAGIAFMGNEWDKDRGGRDRWIAWLAEMFGPALRALKPGGHALVWALPRTSHWTAMALELAGFEIRDVHHHLFGTGFPKSLTSKSAPIPEGTGTALKPAVEHWILARKPSAATIGETYKQHGTGVLRIDACRIDAASGRPKRVMDRGSLVGNTYSGGLNGAFCGSRADGVTDQGRWPAHLSLEHAETCATGACVLGCPVRLLDEQSGVTKPSKPHSFKSGDNVLGVMNDDGWKPKPITYVSKGDGGGASRFFYVAKGSRSEKDAGLDHLLPRTGGEATRREDGSPGTQSPRAGAGRTGGARNHHPTVKSVDLMRWLIRLITPPGGVVLDMFAGSGTTGVGALTEGCRFIGCEMTDEYLPILEGRIRHALEATK